MQLRALAILSTLALATGLLGSRNLTAADSPAAGKEPQPGPTTNAPVATPATGKTVDKCLDCHGPFDKLIAGSTNYVASSGEKTSPHRYVPHDSKLDKDIPQCTRCHTAHPLSPLPAKGSIDLSKLNVQWCFETCHHENNLKSCKECHP